MRVWGPVWSCAVLQGQGYYILLLVSSHSVCKPVPSAHQAQRTELCLQSQSPTHTGTAHAQCRPPRSSPFPWESTSHLLWFQSQHHNMLMPQRTHGEPSHSPHMLLRGEPEALPVLTAGCTPHEVPSTLARRYHSIRTKRVDLSVRTSGFKSQLTQQLLTKRPLCASVFSLFSQIGDSSI